MLPDVCQFLQNNFANFVKISLDFQLILSNFFFGRMRFKFCWSLPNFAAKSKNPAPTLPRRAARGQFARLFGMPPVVLRELASSSARPLLSRPLSATSDRRSSPASAGGSTGSSTSDRGVENSSKIAPGSPDGVPGRGDLGVK